MCQGTYNACKQGAVLQSLRTACHHRWKPGDFFQASALCASVIEAASTPYRLSANPPTGPLGLPIGACDLPSLTQLLVTICTRPLPAADCLS